VEVNGRLSARLYCDGTVMINKGGHLEGTLYAKAITVEKGGIFSGELFIGQKDPSQPMQAEQGSLFGDEALQLKPA
jgi:cytoskeletal protein CcmA (bactofilin family)